MRVCVIGFFECVGVCMCGGVHSLLICFGSTRHTYKTDNCSIDFILIINNCKIFYYSVCTAMTMAK